MELILQTGAPPLHQDVSRTSRISNSRVLLELVIHIFEDGETPETIARQYLTTALTDIYSVIAYYLSYRDEIGAYLATRERKAEEVKCPQLSRQNIGQS